MGDGVYSTHTHEDRTTPSPGRCHTDLSTRTVGLGRPSGQEASPSTPQQARERERERERERCVSLLKPEKRAGLVSGGLNSPPMPGRRRAVFMNLLFSVA